MREGFSQKEQLQYPVQEWGYGIAGHHLQNLAEAMRMAAAGYRRRSEGLNDEKKQELQGRLMQASREMLAKQYDCLAELFDEVSGGFADGNKQRRELRDFIKERLLEEHIRVRQIIFVPVAEKRREIHMMARLVRGEARLADELAGLLSQLLGVTYVPAERCQRILDHEYGYYIFREAENYYLVTGAVRASKSAGEPSGDNFLIMQPCFGEAAMILSDGMGTGEKADRESAAVIELIEKFLLAGFRKEAVISLINSVILLENEANAYATLDLCLLNLFDGEAVFAKSGAAAAFIKHEDWVEKVDDSGLPLGILPDIQPVITKRRLYHGEYVFLVSDGVLECLPEDKNSTMMRYLQNMTDGRPQEMAGAILLMALQQNHYEPTDDMTVLAAKLVQR